MGIPEILMTVLLSFVGAALLIFLIWLFLTASRRPGKEIKKYTAVRFAHRGLHGNGAEENSITAFRRAVEHGYGIELDIRLSRDGVLVVHHDASLSRVCGIDKRVIDLDSEELGKIKLGSTDDTVPTFREVLDTVDGRVPILIEIKNDVDEGGVAEKFIEEIQGYKGEYIVESFNPLALKKVRKLRPDILIGIISMEYTKDENFRRKLLYRQLEKLRLNFLFRPDFISYNQNGYGVCALKMLRKLYKTPLFAWTVRSAEQETAARLHGFDTVIFEKYIPDGEREDNV